MTQHPSSSSGADNTDGESQPAHPLVTLFADLARGIYPPVDGITDAMPRAPGALAAVLAFTGHCVVAADVEPGWGAVSLPPRAT